MYNPDEKAQEYFRTMKTGSHPGLNQGHLTLAVSALPPQHACACMYMYRLCIQWRKKILWSEGERVQRQ